MHLARFIESRDSVINTTKKITLPCNRLSRHLPRLNELTWRRKGYKEFSLFFYLFHSR